MAVLLFVFQFITIGLPTVIQLIASSHQLLICEKLINQQAQFRWTM